MPRPRTGSGILNGGLISGERGQTGGVKHPRVYNFPCVGGVEYGGD